MAKKPKQENIPMATEATAESNKTQVQMTDGRTVGFTPKQRLNKDVEITESGTVVVRLDFRNGETRSFTVPDALMTRFAGHGALQKLGDAIAGEKEDDDAVLAVDDLIERLNRGEWAAARAAGSGFAGASILIKALVESSGKDVATIKAWVSNKTQAEKLALRRSDKLRPIIERLEAEKAKTSKTQVDTGALLGELDSIAA